MLIFKKTIFYIIKMTSPKPLMLYGFLTIHNQSSIYFFMTTSIKNKYRSSEVKKISFDNEKNYRYSVLKHIFRSILIVIKHN